MNKSKVFATTQFVFFFSIPRLRTRSHSQSCSLALDSGAASSLPNPRKSTGCQEGSRSMTAEGQSRVQGFQKPEPHSWILGTHEGRLEKQHPWVCQCVICSKPSWPGPKPFEASEEESLASRNNLDGVQSGGKGKKNCASICQAFVWEKINTKSP